MLLSHPPCATWSFAGLRKWRARFHRLPSGPPHPGTPHTHCRPSHGAPVARQARCRLTSHSRVSPLFARYTKCHAGKSGHHRICPRPRHVTAADRAKGVAAKIEAEARVLAAARVHADVDATAIGATSGGMARQNPLHAKNRTKCGRARQRACACARACARASVPGPDTSHAGGRPHASRAKEPPRVRKAVTIRTPTPPAGCSPRK